MNPDPLNTKSKLRKFRLWAALTLVAMLLLSTDTDLVFLNGLNYAIVLGLAFVTGMAYHRYTVIRELHKNVGLSGAQQLADQFRSL